MLFGLEIAASLIERRHLKDLWRMDKCCGHLDFRARMGRDRFTEIRANLTLVPPDTDPVVHDHDPLWGCRSLMTHFVRNCSSVAVPNGSSI